MEQNVRTVADRFLADKIMDVINQFGIFNKCERCRFAIITGKYGLQVHCVHDMRPSGLDDGCDLWRPRRG